MDFGLNAIYTAATHVVGLCRPMCAVGRADAFISHADATRDADKYSFG